MRSLRDYAKRVVVAGSRSYNDYLKFSNLMNRYLKWLGKEDLAIITGSAWEGPDRMVIQWCKENDIPYFEFPADWEKHGKRAGFIRNCEMRDACTHLFVFWDCISKGTAHMMDECYKHEDIKIMICIVEPDIDYYKNKHEKQKRLKAD